jgi:DNA-binding MarR family transcriptional regulator
MTERQDPVEWSREQWIAHDQPAPDQFTAMVAILRTHGAMTASIDATLRTHELTRTGYLLMTTLQLSRDGTRPLGQLSRHLLVHPTTVTLALDQLEKRKLVRRNPHPTDRRTILAVLTRRGRRSSTGPRKRSRRTISACPASTANCRGMSSTCSVTCGNASETGRVAEVSPGRAPSARATA